MSRHTALSDTNQNPARDRNEVTECQYANSQQSRVEHTRKMVPISKFRRDGKIFTASDSISLDRDAQTSD